MKSQRLFSSAREFIPGGVNSPVRACKSVNADPVFVNRGDKAYIYSADGERFVDLIGSWGPLILGHRHPMVMAALERELKNGTSYGAPTELEVKFAKTIVESIPSIELVRAVSSGTEATMSALRLARGFTGRPKIIKVDGGYHGHADCLLVAAGSGAATLGIPGSAGVPEGAAADTLLVPYNDAQAVADIAEKFPDQIAALIIEPVAGNMGVVPPNDGYLQALREITEKHGIVLIFDEVMTGFRVAYGGAQLRYDIRPDLTCLGKVIGGGMPAAAFGGRKDIMDYLAPAGPVYQAGTLSGNPLSMAAGIATLEQLRDTNPYPALEAAGAKLEEGLHEAANKHGVAHTINRVGSMLTLFFTGDPVENYEDAKRANTERFGAFFAAMRKRGMFLPPSQYEGWFLSTEHDSDIIDQIISAADASLGELT